MLHVIDKVIEDVVILYIQLCLNGTVKFLKYRYHVDIMHGLSMPVMQVYEEGLDN